MMTCQRKFIMLKGYTQMKVMVAGKLTLLSEMVHLVD